MVKYRFSFGPWNIHTGADPFGPPVRDEFSFREKVKIYKKLGFEGVQFHDDDVVPADAGFVSMKNIAKKMKRLLDNEGLEAEFVAPRLWEHKKTIDGGATSNDPNDRKYAYERSKRTIDIANILGTNRIVLWPAREGTYIREAKDPVIMQARMTEYINELLNYDGNIKILGEMKPNEPVDLACVPTTGHFVAIAYKTVDPERVGILVESAHAILAGLDPSEEMAFAIAHNKLWGVHLNDQNGLKFDEDKSFGSVDLRRAFNQVYVLERYGYGSRGEFVGLDIKAMRTQKKEISYKHLENSKKIFLALVGVARSIDEKKVEKFRIARDYEGLEMYIMEKLLNI